MLGFGLFFALTSLCVRHLSETLPPIQIAFFRNVLGLILIVPLLLKDGTRLLKTSRPGMHLLRSTSGLIAMYAMFTAISLLPLAESTALTFTSPLFATMGAALFLGEVVGKRRWSATVVGFLGAMIILRPGIAAISPAALIALVAAVFIASSMLMVKSLSRTENPTTIVFYMTSIMAVMSLPAALYIWVPPTPESWPWLIALGLIATSSQLMMARAFRAAEASVVLPFDFSRLIFASIVGYLYFGEIPDLWTWVGAGVIFASTLYIAQREARLGKVVIAAKISPPT